MHAVDEHAAIAHGGQPRINNLRQGPILVRDFVTHVACMLQKCRNVGSRNKRHTPFIHNWERMCSPHDMNMIYPHSICTLESRVIHRGGMAGHHVEIMTMSSISIQYQIGMGEATL